MQRENYLLHKIKLYQSNPEACYVEYNLSCFEFYYKTIIETFEFIKNNLTENENFWKWNNLIKKSFPNKPLSMLPMLQILAHRIVKTEVL